MCFDNHVSLSRSIDTADLATVSCESCKMLMSPFHLSGNTSQSLYQWKCLNQEQRNGFIPFSQAFSSSMNEVSYIMISSTSTFYSPRWSLLTLFTGQPISCCHKAVCQYLLILASQRSTTLVRRKLSTATWHMEPPKYIQSFILQWVA